MFIDKVTSASVLYIVKILTIIVFLSRTWSWLLLYKDYNKKINETILTSNVSQVNDLRSIPNRQP